MHGVKQFSPEVGTEIRHIQNCHEGPVLDSVERKTNDIKLEHCGINAQQPTCNNTFGNVASSAGNASCETLSENSHIAHLHSKADDECAKCFFIMIIRMTVRYDTSISINIHSVSSDINTCTAKKYMDACLRLCCS